MNGASVACPIHSVGVGGRPMILVADIRPKCSSAIRISNGNGEFPRDSDAPDVEHRPGAWDEWGVAVGRDDG